MSKKPKKIDLITVTPDMSREEILHNLLKMLRKQGIEVKEVNHENKQSS